MSLTLILPRLLFLYALVVVDGSSLRIIVIVLWFTVHAARTTSPHANTWYPLLHPCWCNVPISCTSSLTTLSLTNSPHPHPLRISPWCVLVFYFCWISVNVNYQLDITGHAVLGWAPGWWWWIVLGRRMHAWWNGNSYKQRMCATCCSWSTRSYMSCLVLVLLLFLHWFVGVMERVPCWGPFMASFCE